jgi:hypothetical protein
MIERNLAGDNEYWKAFWKEKGGYKTNVPTRISKGTKKQTTNGSREINNLKNKIENITPEEFNKFNKMFGGDTKTMADRNATRNHYATISGGDTSTPWTTVTTTYVNGQKVEETYGNTNSALWFSNVPPVTKEDFIPIKVIYSCPATICYFKDGTKEVVKVASDEEYVQEEGVMACIMKKLFRSRNEFKRLVNSGYENEEAEVERVLHNGSVEHMRDKDVIDSIRAFTTKK